MRSAKDLDFQPRGHGVGIAQCQLTVDITHLLPFDLTTKNDNFKQEFVMIMKLIYLDDAIMPNHTLWSDFFPSLPLHTHCQLQLHGPKIFNNTHYLPPALHAGGKEGGGDRYSIKGCGNSQLMKIDIKPSTTL